MKGVKNLVKIGALTGLILVVITSGMAFATGGTYSGTQTSTYSGSGNLVWNGHASGSKGTVVANDWLYWNNQLYNNAGYPVTGYVGGMTDPAGPDGTGGITNNENSGTVTSIGWSVQHGAQVIKTGSHNINPYHTYKDGNNFYTIADNGYMSYY